VYPGQERHRGTFPTEGEGRAPVGMLPRAEAPMGNDKRGKAPVGNALRGIPSGGADNVYPTHGTAQRHVPYRLEGANENTSH
jgi:hypothetical protein